MSRRHSSLFLHINTSPNPDANPGLWGHRLRQRRPISRNPFEPEHSSAQGYGLTASDSPPASPSRRQSLKSDEGKPGYLMDMGDKESVTSTKKNLDLEWGEQAPGWLNLFYDLAWTATFSSLTSNAKFKDPWDSVSYVVFFTTAWWLWISQVFYSVDFYTDDWFHLVAVFLQLVIFGALAATTRDFDVTSYILHSPGSDNLEPYDIETLTPDRYGAERLTKISLRVIMLVISISRLLLLIQHLRVAIYARLTAKTKGYPLRLLIVPASLAISSALFFAAFRVTMTSGKEPRGAKIKFILWGVALLVEIVTHIIRFEMDIGEGIKLRSHGSITGRLSDITTIIIGEGINAVAGTFYAIEQAPGFSRPTATGIICCAVVVFFLAYLYFEGAAPLKSVRRRAAWAMMHFPWLLSVILLLEGVKNQLLLSSFMSSGGYMMTKLADNVFADVSMEQFNATMRPILLQGGLSYNDQWAEYMGMINANITANPNSGNMTEAEIDSVVSEILGVWYLRLQLSATLNTYITFMDNDSIPDTTQQTIQNYQNNYNYTLEDYKSAVNSDGNIPHFFQILNELMEPSLDNGRYIMAMCGATFITLASLNLIQSWPRDRFHWASIFSRYAMGIAMTMLLLLNLGKSQTYIESVDTPESQRAGVLRWIDAGWVLPTLALAYAIQFIIDTILVYLAVWTSRKAAFTPVRQDEKI